MFHYLDNAATTQTRPEAAQAAVTAMTEEWGNPSSRYAFGQEASGRLKEHRAQVAAGLGCRPEEVYFLSCGTEGDNWAIAAAVEKNRRKGKHIITTAIEHAAVLEPIRELERQGYEIRVVDLLNMEKSHCYNPFSYLKNDNDVQKMVTNLFKATTPKGSQSNDPFWGATRS